MFLSENIAISFTDVLTFFLFLFLFAILIVLIVISTFFIQNKILPQIRSWKNHRRANSSFKILKERFTDEEIDKLLFRDDKEQFEIFNKAEAIVLDWSKQNNVHLNNIIFQPMHEYPSVIYIFFDNDNDLSEYQSNGTTENIEKMFYTSFYEMDYFILYNSKVIYRFDSHENVKNNYKDSYFFYLKSYC